MPALHHGYCTFTVYNGTNLVPAFVEAYIDQVIIGIIGLNTASYIQNSPKILRRFTVCDGKDNFELLLGVFISNIP